MEDLLVIIEWLLRLVGGLLHSSEWFPAAVGAFFAAIAAFSVSQFNEKVRRHRKRWLEHFNALVPLDHALNETVDRLWANRALAHLAIDAIGQAGKGITVIYRLPSPLPRSDAHLRSYLRLELINEVFSFNVKIRRLNGDIRTVCEAYAEMRSGLLRQELRPEQYHCSLTQFQANLQNLVKAFDLVLSRTLDLHARVRVTMKEDKRHNNDTFWKFLNGTPNLAVIDSDRLQSELVQMKREMDDVQARSREEIRQWYGDSTL